MNLNKTLIVLKNKNNILAIVFKLSKSLEIVKCFKYAFEKNYFGFLNTDGYIDSISTIINNKTFKHKDKNYIFNYLSLQKFKNNIPFAFFGFDNNKESFMFEIKSSYLINKENYLIVNDELNITEKLSNILDFGSTGKDLLDIIQNILPKEINTIKFISINGDDDNIEKKEETLVLENDCKTIFVTYIN